MTKIIAKAVEYKEIKYDDVYLYEGSLYVRGSGREISSVDYPTYVYKLMTEEKGENN